MDFLSPVHSWPLFARHQGPTNELLFLDLVGLKWRQLRASTPFPTPRAFHVAVFLNGQMWIYGGQDAYGSVLSDLWSAAFGDDGASLTWTPVVDKSTTRPAGRSMHGAVVALGQVAVQL